MSDPTEAPRKTRAEELRDDYQYRGSGKWRDPRSHFSSDTVIKDYKGKRADLLADLETAEAKSAESAKQASDLGAKEREARKKADDARDQFRRDADYADVLKMILAEQMGIPR